MMLLISIFLIVLFQVAIWKKWLGKDPGSRWIDHSTFILLLAIPLPTAGVGILYPFLYGLILFYWVFGIYAYIDDVYNHWRIGKGQKFVETYGGVSSDMYYHSPLHIWGERQKGDWKRTLKYSVVILIVWFLISLIFI